MGAREAATPVVVEAAVKYHSGQVGALTRDPEAGVGTVAGGEFDWGGRLLKRNGGAQWSPQAGWKPAGACTGSKGA